MTALETTLTLIGGPTLLLEVAGLRLLTDPTFDPPGSYEARGIVLEKRKGPALELDALGELDALLLSHDQHFDNFDRKGRSALEKAGQTFTTPAGAARLGGRARGLASWETSEISGPAGRLLVTATPARHGPPGIEPVSGEVTGFALGLAAPGDGIYITGDTVWYQGIAEVARRFRPRLVVLFAGSAKPRGPFHVTMDNNDALETAQAFPNARLVTIHNDGWAHFTETQADALRAFETLGVASRLELLEPGRARRITL